MWGLPGDVGFTRGGGVYQRMWGLPGGVGFTRRGGGVTRGGGGYQGGGILRRGGVSKGVGTMFGWLHAGIGYTRNDKPGDGDCDPQGMESC